MKHFAVKEELFQKVMKHLEEKKIKVFIGAWVEKACEDFIDFELLEQQRILIRRRKIEREGGKYEKH